MEAKGGSRCNLRCLSSEETVVVTVHAPAHVDLKDMERGSSIKVCGSTMVDTPKCQVMASYSRLQTWYMLRRNEKKSQRLTTLQRKVQMGKQ